MRKNAIDPPITPKSPEIATPGAPFSAYQTPRVVELLKRCLAKDARERLRDIARAHHFIDTAREPGVNRSAHGENPLFSLVYDTGKIRFLLFRVLLRSCEPPPEQTKKPLVFVGHPGVEKEIILEMRRVQQSRISGLNLRVPHGFVKGRRFE